MNVAEWIRGKRPETREIENYSDAIVALLLERAQGPTEAKVSGTGALEAASGIVGRAFASASVGGAPPLIVDALTPDVLMFIGRAFLRAGESVFAIDTSMGMVDLLPAHTWDIQGVVSRKVV